MAEAYWWVHGAIGVRGKMGIEVIQEWRSNSQDNYSRVTVKGWIGLSSGGPSSDNSGNCKSSFTGTRSYGPVTTNFSNLTASEDWRQIVSYSWDIPHNPDGTASVNFTFNFGPTITQNLGSGGSISAGGSLWSIPRAPSKPAAPTLTYTPPTTIKANGVAPAANGSPIDLYHFLIDTNNPPQDGTQNFRTVSGGSNPTVTINDLAINRTYYVSYAARNAHGWGPRSDTSSLTIGNVPGPPDITSISLSNGNQIALSYTPPTNIGGSSISTYDIQYAPNSSFVNATLLSNVGRTGAHTFNVAPGYDYYFRIRAVNSQGAGAWSSAYGPVKVFAGPKILYPIGGTSAWRDSECYVRHEGVWKFAVPYVRVNGTWRPLDV